MAFTPTAIAAYGAIAAAGTSAYVASQAGKGIPHAPKLPMDPKLPDTKAVSASEQDAEIQAKTAGGTLLSQGKSAVSDGANQVRKTLLGA